MEVRRIPFNVETCPQGIELIFFEGDDWYTGSLSRDTEYGWVIYLFESLTTVKKVTHYFDPTTLL